MENCYKSDHIGKNAPKMVQFWWHVWLVGQTWDTFAARLIWAGTRAQSCFAVYFFSFFLRSTAIQSLSVKHKQLRWRGANHRAQAFWSGLSSPWNRLPRGEGNWDENSKCWWEKKNFMFGGVKNKRCGHSNLQQRTVFNLLFLYYASNVTAVCKFWSCTTTMLMLSMILCCKTITWCFKNSVLFPRLTQSPSGEAVYQLHPLKENKSKVAKTARNMLTDSD